MKKVIHKFAILSNDNRVIGYDGVGPFFPEDINDYALFELEHNATRALTQHLDCFPELKFRVAKLKITFEEA